MTGQPGYLTMVAPKVSDIFCPANSTLNVAKAGTSTIDLFGLQISNDGKSAFSRTFSWAT